MIDDDICYISTKLLLPLVFWIRSRRFCLYLVKPKNPMRIITFWCINFWYVNNEEKHRCPVRKKRSTQELIFRDIQNWLINLFLF